MRFLVVGDGPLRPELAERSRALGLDGRLTFTGVRHDVPELLARADLLVLSSDWEGLPLVALEALAGGTPVLSTPVEGMRELRDGGAASIVPEASAEALAAGMVDLLADARRRAAMGERGRELVAARYSGDAMVDAYERLYLELRRRPGPAS